MHIEGRVTHILHILWESIELGVQQSHNPLDRDRAARGCRSGTHSACNVPTSNRYRFNGPCKENASMLLSNMLTNHMNEIWSLISWWQSDKEEGKGKKKTQWFRGLMGCESDQFDKLDGQLNHINYKFIYKYALKPKWTRHDKTN